VETTHIQQQECQYSVGDKVYLQPTGIEIKLEMQKEGVHHITYMFTNGTVCLQIGAIHDKVNIQRIKPEYLLYVRNNACLLHWHYEQKW
jgi:hypothetical protein